MGTISAGRLLNAAGYYLDEQGRYSEAEPLYLRALPILFERLGETHPNTQTVQRNFLSFLQEVIAAEQTAQLSDHPVTQQMIEELRQGE